MGRIWVRIFFNILKRDSKIFGILTKRCADRLFVSNVTNIIGLRLTVLITPIPIVHVPIITIFHGCYPKSISTSKHFSEFTIWWSCVINITVGAKNAWSYIAFGAVNIVKSWAWFAYTCNCCLAWITGDWLAERSCDVHKVTCGKAC